MFFLVYPPCKRTWQWKISHFVGNTSSKRSIFQPAMLVSGRVTWDGSNPTLRCFCYFFPKKKTQRRFFREGIRVETDHCDKSLNLHGNSAIVTFLRWLVKWPSLERLVVGDLQLTRGDKKATLLGHHLLDIFSYFFSVIFFIPKKVVRRLRELIDSLRPLKDPIFDRTKNSPPIHPLVRAGKTRWSLRP